jgi:acetylornithine deacetylase
MMKYVRERADLVPQTLRLHTGLFSESVQLLQKLITIPSFSGEEAEAADMVQQYLENFSIEVNRRGNNIWCYNKYFDPVKPTILLNSHLDTVRPNEAYTLDLFARRLMAAVYTA